MEKKDKIIISIILFVVSAVIFFRVFCGIFVIQPMRILPEGATIIYWRTCLNTPFITSADGLLARHGAIVNPLSRGVVLMGLINPIMDRKIISFGYSERLYLLSTGGRKYNLPLNLRPRSSH
jgi:hypothetical protein